MENIIKSTADSVLKKALAFSWADGINILFSFLLGRVVIFDCMSPFALAFLAAYANNNPENMIRGFIIAAAAIAGGATAGLNIFLIKYLLAFILFGLIFTAVSTLTDKRSSFATSGIAAVSLAISGVILLGQGYATMYNILMLAAECIICFAVGAASGRSLKIISEPRAVKNLSFDAVVGLFALAAFSVLGFGNLSVGAINIGNALAGVYIMIIAATSGIGGGSAGGIGLGLIYSFAMYPAPDAVGIYGICGLLCGYLNKYKRLGIISGYVMANIILKAYFGAANGNLLSGFDIITAVIMFCLIPKGALHYIENIVNMSVPSNRLEKKTIDNIAQKLKDMSKSILEIAGSFGENFFTKAPDNKNDVMLLYDRAADRICKRCGLKFVCWEREFNQTYDQLSRLTPVLQKKGFIEMQDTPESFRQKCIKLTPFIETVNKLFLRYKLDNMWVKKVEAGKQLVSQHLYGFAEIMESFAEETKKQLDFVPNPDNILYLSLRKYGVKCSDVSIIKTEAAQFEVTVRAHTGADQTKTVRHIVDVSSEILGRRFYVKSITEAADGKKIIVKMLEREKYSVKTGCASRKKDGSESCGDSYCQRKLEHNRHIAILSDGMGSGENARQQSGYAVDVMLRLLNSGFNKDCAVKIMNLSLFLKQTEEGFATVDAAVIDLFDGNAEFIKIGATSSYIKRGDKIKKIASDSLPAGMITDITPCTERVDIKSGDIIVLTSDGVTDSSEWLYGYLKTSTEKNPQKLAENIVKEAVIRNGYKALDDMTVITLLIDEEIA